MARARPPDELDAHLDAEGVELVKCWHLDGGEEVGEADVEYGVSALGLAFEEVGYELGEDELCITISDAEIPRRDALQLISGDLLDVLADEDPEAVGQLVAALDLDLPAGGPAVGFE